MFPAKYKIVSIFNYSECDFPCMISPQVQFFKAQGKVVELLPRTKLANKLGTSRIHETHQALPLLGTGVGNFAEGSDT